MKPIAYQYEYLKYGFVKTLHHAHKCPVCGKQLNAGPNWAPKHCEECGAPIDWTGVQWLPDETMD